MATAFDSKNAFNLLETAGKNCVQADAWLGDTANVTTVHEKIRRHEEDPFDLYYDHELPAIGVLCIGAGEDDRSAMQEWEHGYRLLFDVWHAGADFDTVDQEFKKIMAYLRRRLRLQTFATTTHAESDQLDGIAEDGDVFVLDTPDFDYFGPQENGGWLIHGIVLAQVTLISAD